MNIVSFYSYKGGAGRSLCLANIAAALNLTLGQRVGLIDLDCEAAGLHQLFNVKVNPDADLLNYLYPKNRSLSKIEKYVCGVPIQSGVAAGLFLIPTISDANLLNKIPWDKSIETFLTHDLFPTMGSLFNLDYLLIDARSGLSDNANYALRTANLNIFVCRPDRQNQFGISKLIEISKAANKPYLVALSACPNPIKNQNLLAPFFQAIGEETDFIFPYVENLYFGEYVATIKAPKSNLAKTYTKLATAIHKMFKE